MEATVPAAKDKEFVPYLDAVDDTVGDPPDEVNRTAVSATTAATLTPAMASFAEAEPATDDLRAADGRRRRGEDLVRPVGGDGVSAPRLVEERFELVVADHWVPSSSSAKGLSVASALRRRRASCSRDFTVPGRRWIATAISFSDSPA